MNPPRCLRRYPQNENDTYDYIVVGGGTAGNVIATRLSQRHRVALIEAGERYEDVSLAKFPAADTLGFGSAVDATSPIDWGFVAEPGPGTNGRRVHYSRGKCLGGSSALNGMMYTRPTVQAMDRWADMVNDNRYTYKNSLPYFQKSVTFTPPKADLRAANATVNYNPDAFDNGIGDAPVDVSYANFAQPFSSWMKLAMESIGITETQDFNSGSLAGAQYCTSTIRPSDETRSSSASFLDALNTELLTVYTGTLAKKVIFDANRKAVGVHIQDKQNSNATLSAKKEVIVSAGAFQSPQLLMVSGIGPAETLQAHDIDIVVDLPGVGQNMWDHPFVAPSYRVNLPTLTTFGDQILLSADSLNGPMTNPVSDYMAWEHLPNRSPVDHYHGAIGFPDFPTDGPEVEYISGAGHMGNLSNLLAIQPRDGYNYAAILGTLNVATSRGNITINSADMVDPPVIAPNWLSTEHDMKMMIYIFKRMRQAFQSDAMAPIVIGEEYFPGNGVESDGEIEEYIKNNVMGIWHASCTCKMGTNKDPLAVVDSQARVFGVDGLRVVDASAFPFLPPGHPQSIVYMLAEVVADFILSGDT
ncbi:hypothetical protein BDV25DRAFT_169031 [Aspergillus avenaceus]|uniref:Glucose-methanol-choline oxidoreductase N-terminal domain-containing protein n=1 Tax=Aspergillus avenaceus TaxID=36643 RepID=A0A5N6U484_ASPAV|nr:hypothetical protein BDV25DRAFT_169031 [Aspergillus avenaceus]